MSNNDGVERFHVVYTGQRLRDVDIPRGTTHVRVHPSVKSIDQWTFLYSGLSSSLTTVDLGDGVEEIGESAFRCFRLLVSIVIPPSVKLIKDEAFSDCDGLTAVTLGAGLEEIGGHAFSRCSSIQHIDIPPSVKAIKGSAFRYCTGLMSVKFSDGLKVIGDWAFQRCILLLGIIIPPSVYSIGFETFSHCSGLMTAQLGDGLVVIGRGAFLRCTSLEHIVIPPSVKRIEESAFSDCTGLVSVQLGDGLETIGHCAFHNCTSLQRIDIPRAVTSIQDNSFSNCFNLTHVRFCEEIENFVSGESMRGWWNQMNHRMSMISTYCFLVRRNIPERVDLLGVRMWQANIQEKMRQIPSVLSMDLNSYFDSIESKLSVYENLKTTLTLLELAIWKSKITEQLDQNNNPFTAEMKMQCRTDSVAEVTIIVPIVLSFLPVGSDENYVPGRVRSRERANLPEWYDWRDDEEDDNPFDYGDYY